MKITIHVYTQSVPLSIDNAVNAYQKGDLYCVLLDDESVVKVPLVHIFRITEREG